MSRPARRSFPEGLWRLADPKVSLASIASMTLASLVVAAGNALSPVWLAITVAGILSLEVAKNASGEIFDFRSGTDLAVQPGDRSPFSGGKRVLVDELLTARQTALIAAAGYTLFVGFGLAVVWFREPRVLWLGVAGLACAWFYHAPPLALSYRGLGEIAVALCYGPLIAGGTALVLSPAATLDVLWISIPLGLLIAAFLWINEFPDHDADRASGKRTLVVRLGKERAARAFAGLVGSAFLVLLLLPLVGVPLGVWLGGVAALPAVDASRRLLAAPRETPRVIPAQARTLAAFVLYAVASGAGVWLQARLGWG